MSNDINLISQNDTRNIDRMSIKHQILVKEVHLEIDVSEFEENLIYVFGVIPTGDVDWSIPVTKFLN